MTDRELLELALEALELEDMACRYEKDPTPEHIAKAITAIREALAEQPAQQEPVAWVHIQGRHKELSHLPLDDGEISRGWEQYPLYTSPPASKPWVGLTNEEMNAALNYWSEDERSAYGGAHAADGEYVSMIDTWRYIESKLKEKNCD